MKKILLFLIVLFVPIVLNSQTVSEKMICKFDNLNELDVYSFKFDEKTGTYVYLVYDSTKVLKNSIISNKGNSGDYDFINNYQTLFDSEGNYYLVVYISITDTSGKYAFMKNGKEIFTYDYINSELAMVNDKIMMQCTDKGKSFLTSYDIRQNTFAKGNEYDEIMLCKFDKNQYEGEPIPKIGITKDDKPYFIAKSNNKSFFVIGSEEQKQYADIDAYTVVEDKQGTFAFVAKDTGSFMYSGGNFVVYGDKRFKAFYSIYNLLFDDKGNVYYLATDYSDDLFPQRVMKNDIEYSKVYDGGIYYLDITPDGKLYYVANKKQKGSDEYESFVVFDGKAHKTYSSVYNLKLYPGNELVYTAQPSADKYLVVRGKQEYPVDKKSTVLSAEILEDNTLAYITVEYGDYDKKIKDKNYVFIDDKKFGPFDGMYVVDYQKNNYVISDKNGNYAFTVNNIKDFTDYYYVLHTNNKKSAEFENIFDVQLYKGKALFTAFRLYDKVKYTYKYRLYYDFKPITPEYDSINEYKFDEKTGTASFYVSKGNEIYKVEVKL